MKPMDLSRDGLLALVRDAWESRDPVPEGLVERMQAAVAAEAMLADADLDYELLLLVEQSRELNGARGTAAYTLRFALEETELLLRASPNDGAARLDGWLAPPSQMHVRAEQVVEAGEGRSFEADSDERGRFEFDDLPPGLYRLWLTPLEAGGRAFGTPAFEI
jgi:hypothetical protein